jgi:hypothetical protein
MLMFLRLLGVSILLLSGGCFLAVNTSLFLHVQRARTEVLSNIANGVPANPLEPDGWQGKLDHIVGAQMLVTFYLILSLALIIAGLALLYWPFEKRRNGVRSVAG